MTDYVFAETSGAPDAPLVFTFHGTGGSETQFHGFPKQVLPDAHVISPRGDVLEMGARRFFRRTGEGVYDMEDLAKRTEALHSFVTAHKARVGAARVIGLGYSNGANILAALAFRDPTLFTDLALMHPLIPWDPAPKPELADMRVLITAGRQDPICPPALTERLVAWLNAQKAQTEEFWHIAGHEITQGEVDALVKFLAAAG